MKLSERIQQETRQQREFLLSAPIIQRALTGSISREEYLAFLTQAYHHVRHTVPLMMAVGSRLRGRHAWLQGRILHYLEEEAGHDRWILGDIRAAGGDPEAAASSPPDLATEAMVAFAYDMVTRVNPVGFFGMVHVLEGTSAAIATRAADSIRTSLGLPPSAFTYLSSHGKLDQEHVHHLADILDRLDMSEDQEAVLRCARAIFWLYGNMFRGLEQADLRQCA